MNDIEPALGQGVILCDNFIREEGSGKLSFLGSFQNFNFSQFPAISPPFCVVALITNLSGQLEKLTVTVRVEDPRSGHVINSSSIEIGFKKGLEKDEIFEIPFRIAPSQFHTTGIYQLVVLINNERLGHKDFRVDSTTSAHSIK